MDDIIIGKNTVREAIKSGRDIDALFVSKTAVDGSARDIVALARKHGVIVKEVPAKKLDELSVPYGHNGAPANHQGVVARIPSVKYSTLDDIFRFAEQTGREPFIVALDGITDPYNLGAIVRSAEALGAHGIVLPERRSAAMNAAACKTACGAEEHLPIVKVGNLARAIEDIKQRGVWVAAADMDGQNAEKTDLTGPLMLIIGAEGEGVGRLVKEKSDFVVSIPLKGKVASLNASAAAAVLIYEKLRQEARSEKDGGKQALGSMLHER